MFDDYLHHDALGLAELIRTREVHPKEVVEAAILRAEKVNPEINAIVTPLYDYAHERVQGDLSGPFAGVPFLLKDVHHALEGTPMSNGSRLHQGELSTFTAEIVRRFTKAGLVVFGKTNTPEYKASVFTVPKAWGPTRNPWDVTRSAGGSSGGSAAAVAAGIVPMASATDEGGSIRMPASACGVFGLKPSRGRNPVGPDFIWEAEGLSTSHVVSRSVRDTAAMLDVTHGLEPGSPYCAPAPPTGGFLHAAEREPGKLRVGISTATEVFGAKMEPGCIDAVHVTASLLEDLGHDVEEVVLPYDEWEVLRTVVLLMAANAATLVARLEAEYGRSRVRKSLEEVTLLLARTGRAMSGEVLASSRLSARRIGLAVSRFFDRYDVLVTPTLGRIPVRLEKTQPTAGEQRLLRFLVSPGAAGLFGVPRLRERILDAQLESFSQQVLHRTMVANLTGIPAMSVPLHRTENELPVGVQFLGRFGDEVSLLRLATQLERAMPWRVRS
ncbi:MAG TPA: amidase [Polyangiales bacterium]|nr:amidase [Polyangiales bacterium]